MVDTAARHPGAIRAIWRHLWGAVQGLHPTDRRMKRTPAGLDLLTGSHPDTLPIVHWHRDKDKTAKKRVNSITNEHSDHSTRRPLLAGSYLENAAW